MLQKLLFRGELHDYNKDCFIVLSAASLGALDLVKTCESVSSHWPFHRASHKDDHLQTEQFHTKWS